MDLFGDLPEPTQPSGPAPVQPNDSKEENHNEADQDGGLKRKKGPDDAEDQEEVKRVCREGFQPHNVCPGSEALWRLDEENGTRCRTLTCFYRR